MVTEKTWNEFRATGLLLIINQILHIFGWAIVIEYDDDDVNKVIGAYPARVKFRGFDGDTASKAYVKLSKYMKDNADELYKEAEE